MPKTVILGTARTPIGKMGGSLSTLDATELGGIAIEAALERAGVEPEQVAARRSWARSSRPARARSPRARPRSRAASRRRSPRRPINKVCASGMRAVGLLDQAIRAGDVEVGVGGGMESMSQAPYLLPGARFGFRMGDVKALDAMIHDGLTNPFTGKQMFDEATEIGDELEITRPDLDRWALRSHELAAEATDDGRLPEEIVAVTIKSRKGDTVVEVDEAPRRGTHARERSPSCPGSSARTARHTAGNSPGVNDGAGALVLASDEWAAANGKEAARRRSSPTRSRRRRLRLPRQHARERRQKALEKVGMTADGRRPLGDQRGVRLGHAQLDPDARHRRGEGQRQRRRGRARSPDRRLRRPHHRHARARAAPPRRRPRLRGDLLRRRPGRRRRRRGCGRVAGSLRLTTSLKERNPGDRGPSF